MERATEKDHVVRAVQEYPEKRLESALKAYGKAHDVDMPARNTVWRWTKADPEFEEEYEEARGNRAESQFEAVRDSLIERVVDGKASGAETIFTLVNLARQVPGESENWKDLKRIDVTTGGERLERARELVDAEAASIPEPVADRMGGGNGASPP